MIIVLMGVTGSGKTTVGQALADRLGWKYFDADQFHPQANIQKMKRGTPLTDGDRQPWLEQLQRLVRACLDQDESAVLACSALKQSYRDMLLIDEKVRLVYLKGDYSLIEERLRSRRDHYMKPELLRSQFETLEEPNNALLINIAAPLDLIVEVIRAQLRV